MVDAKLKREELIIEAKNFFDSYKKEVGDKLKKGSSVIYMDFMKLAEFSNKLSDEILSDPEEALRFMEIAIEESGLVDGARVRLYNLPKDKEMKVRNIRSRNLNELIVIEGIIRQASDVRPQVVNAKFECPSCGTVLSVLQIEKKFREPARCSCGRKGGFKLISKEMVDTQRLVIEEAPESLSGGEQPKRINIFVKEDLVEPRMEEKTTPGSRVRIIGILKEVPVPLHTGGLSTRFELAIETNNIIPLEETFEELNISDEDEKQILELAADPKIFENLTKSIAPNIWGYDEIKRSLILQLFGGVPKIHKDGQKNRGDIHILLIGDPGVAKSQMLNFISNISPKGRYVVGKSTSGAGLTATVVRDEYLRGWSLEAGAMVLSNKGLVAIDELEKMDPQDRSAMHEAMEQQCYHYDTLITLANGEERKIGELVEELMKKNRDKIIQGKNCLILKENQIEILTTDFNKVYKTKIDRVSKHKAFDKLVRIKFSHGREIKVTPEHPVFVAKNGKIITKKADQIKIGDNIPIPLYLPIEGKEQYFKTKTREAEDKRIKQKPVIPAKNCKELFKIVGYLLSEGSREKNRGKLIGINFTNGNEQVLNDLESLMKKVFNLSPYKQLKIDNNKARFLYRYISSQLAKFLKETMPEILHLSQDKHIPQFAMRGKKEYLAQMLSALFEGDGYASIKERTIRVGYKTKSKRLAEQIQDLLLRFGIRSSITENREFYRVGITEYSNLEKFRKEIGFITKRKNIILDNYLKEKILKRHVKNRIPLEFSERVIDILKEESIKEVGKYKIYDIVYDHLIRKDKFAFSNQFLVKLLPLLKNPKNIEFIRSLTSDIGWEKVSGIEMINNEDEDWVYDLTVEPSHAFISQASVLHNTVTISKANVQASLKAETSVLAAANPKFGRFDPYQSVAQQIDLPPTLINRFDIIFTLRDIPSREKDEKIATHVLRGHQKEGEDMFIPRELFRKYVAYAKQKVKPKLTDEAIEEIKRFYIDLRNMPVSSESGLRPIPISARQLHALIRMSEASAKIRLSQVVTRDDAKKSIDIMKYYLMQVGYDYESKTIDLDRISGKFSTSQRNKIFNVRDVIISLEERLGKMIPIEEIEKELQGKMTKEEISEAIDKLNMEGTVFKPRRGYVGVA
jgi:replicative DNA helicase Mcm